MEFEDVEEIDGSNPEVHPSKTPVKLPGIINDKLFSLHGTGKTTNGVTSISAKCLLCIKEKIVQCDSKTSGNLLKHLKVSV